MLFSKQLIKMRHPIGKQFGTTVIHHRTVCILTEAEEESIHRHTVHAEEKGGNQERPDRHQLKQNTPSHTISSQRLRHALLL